MQEPTGTQVTVWGTCAYHHPVIPVLLSRMTHRHHAEQIPADIHDVSTRPDQASAEYAKHENQEIPGNRMQLPTGIPHSHNMDAENGGTTGCSAILR